MAQSYELPYEHVFTTTVNGKKHPKRRSYLPPDIYDFIGDLWEIIISWFIRLFLEKKIYRNHIVRTAIIVFMRVEKLGTFWQIIKNMSPELNSENFQLSYLSTRKYFVRSRALKFEFSSSERFIEFWVFFPPLFFAFRDWSARTRISPDKNFSMKIRVFRIKIVASEFFSDSPNFRSSIIFFFFFPVTPSVFW